MEEQQGRYDQAEESYLEALSILRSVFGGDHPALFEGINDVAVVVARRDPEAALVAYSEAEAMGRRLYTDPHSGLASTLNNQALALVRLGRLEESAPLYREAVSMQREIYDGRHPELASTLCNLADLQWQRNDSESAGSTFEEAIGMYAETVGPEHPDTANCLNNHATFLYANGRLDEAETAFERALAATRMSLGDEHDRVGILLNNLGDLARRRGESEQAVIYLEESVGILHRALGEPNSTLGAAVFTYSKALESAGRVSEAAAALRRSMENYEQTYPADHVHLARLRVRLADVELEQGRLDEAERLVAEAIPVLAREPTDGAWWGSARRLLALALARSGRRGDGVAILEETLQRRREAGAGASEIKKLDDALTGIRSATEEQYP